MDERDGVATWEGLTSRDAASRDAAMESIQQDVMKRVGSIGPLPESPCSPSASDLNQILARILMLSRRCPYDDVKEKCIWLLRSIQVRETQSDKKEKETRCNVVGRCLNGDIKMLEGMLMKKPQKFNFNGRICAGFLNPCLVEQMF